MLEAMEGCWCYGSCAGMDDQRQECYWYCGKEFGLKENAENK